MENGAVYLKKGEGRSMKAGGPWVYDNEVERIEGEPLDGDVVSVHDYNGFCLGKGFLNRRSKLRVRMLTRNRNQEIDEDFLRMRVENAWEYRKKVVDTGSCRVIFGEADFLPGLVVDKFSDVLVVQSLALGMDRYKSFILETLKELMAKDGISIRGIYERSDAKVREQEGMPRVKGFLSDPFDTKVEIVENGVRYFVDVAEGQKTGFFLDQKYNRRAADDRHGQHQQDRPAAVLGLLRLGGRLQLYHRHRFGSLALALAHIHGADGAICVDSTHGAFVRAGTLRQLTARSLHRRQQVGLVHHVQKVGLVLLAVLVGGLVIVNDDVKGVAAAGLHRDELLVGGLIVEQVTGHKVAVLGEALAGVNGFHGRRLHRIKPVPFLTAPGVGRDRHAAHQNSGAERRRQLLHPLVHSLSSLSAESDFGTFCPKVPPLLMV